MNIAAARAVLDARHRTEAEALARRHEQEWAALEVAKSRLLDKQRREYVLLGRQQIAARDFLATATEAPDEEASHFPTPLPYEGVDQGRAGVAKD